MCSSERYANTRVPLAPNLAISTPWTGHQTVLALQSGLLSSWLPLLVSEGRTPLLAASSVLRQHLQLAVRFVYVQWLV